MLRLVSSVGRVAPRLSARVSALRSALPAARLAAAQTRAFTQQTCRRGQELEQQEEQKGPIDLPAVRTEIASGLDAQLNSLDASEEPWIAEFLASTGWKVEINLEKEEILASREVEGYKLKLSGEASEYALEDEPEEEEQEEDEEENRMSGHRFTVEVQNEKGGVMRVDCTNAKDGELVLHALSFPKQMSPAGVAANEDKQDVSFLEFDEISEDVQGAYIAFFEALGVDDDLAMFYALQSQMVRTKGFVAKLKNAKKFMQ